MSVLSQMTHALKCFSLTDYDEISIRLTKCRCLILPQRNFILSEECWFCDVNYLVHSCFVSCSFIFLYLLDSVSNQFWRCNEFIHNNLFLNVSPLRNRTLQDRGDSSNKLSYNEFDTNFNIINTKNSLSELQTLHFSNSYHPGYNLYCGSVCVSFQRVQVELKL